MTVDNVCRQERYCVWFMGKKEIQAVWQKLIHILRTQTQGMNNQSRIESCMVDKEKYREHKIQHFAHRIPVHSREADWQEQGTTCERIEKLVGIQAAGVAVKIPFTGRDF